MKHGIYNVLLLMVVLAFGAAPALAYPTPSLNGRIMSCAYDGISGQQDTVYRFFAGPTGENLVQVAQTGFNNASSYVGYVLIGSLLQIGYPIELSYDLSDRSRIERHFTDSVRAAYGGDVTRLDVVETCFLH